MGSLTGKVALITGASRGIGRAVATTLHADGVRLGLASRSGDDLGLSDAVGLKADVRDRGALERAARRPPIASAGSTSSS